jgi:hypothetical protein
VTRYHLFLLFIMVAWCLMTLLVVRIAAGRGQRRS